MSVRSFVRDAVSGIPLAASFGASFALPLAVLTAATGCPGSHKPEADPERLVTLTKAMDKNTPVPGGAPTCKPEQLIGGATMTQVTLLKIAGEPANPGPTRDDWINPPELDSPAARELIDPSLDDTTKRQAAFELLSAPFFLVYRIDIVTAPLALGVKDPKRGFISARVLRFDLQGNIVCLRVLPFEQSLDKSNWAIVKTNLPTVDPKVAAVLRDDLRDVYLRSVAALGRPDNLSNE
jgi:hypothetical protein